MVGTLVRDTKPRRDDTPLIGDLALTLVVTAISIGVAVGAPAGLPAPVSWRAIALTLLGTLPLVVRRRWPLVILAVVALAATAESLSLAVGSPDIGIAGLGLGVSLYTVAIRTERRTSLRLAALIAGNNALILLVGVALGRPHGVLSLIALTATVVGGWSLGDNLRTRRAYLAHLEERARRLEREREESARRAVEEERSRIARELHDVIAHHVSAIVVQAGAGAQVAQHDPERAGEVLGFIQETGREALAEMRTMLNVLRSSDELGTDRAPQPSLAHIERLLNQIRAAGLPVTLQMEGSVRPLLNALDVSAYRIVQEALTNTLKHAGPAHAHVLVRYLPDALELEISDDGRRRPRTPNTAGAGRGLIGMRERAALFGGELVAEPAPGQGFVVRAHLPFRKDGP
jgi:signal transduction histidine kinase